jgi:hypothetical protein
MEQLGFHWIHFYDIWYLRIFRQSLQINQATLKSGTLHEDQYTFMFTSRSLLLRMKNISNTRYRENQNTFNDR